MNSIAFTQQHRIFKRLEAVTNYANLNEQQRHAYDEDLKIFRDFQNCMDFSKKQGKAEGIAEGEAKGRAEERAQSIRIMHEMGIPTNVIAEKYGMPEEDITALLKL